MSEPPPIPAGDPLVIPYATPAQFDLQPGVCREGKLLVVPRDCAVPPRCVRCNEPAELKYTKLRKFYWHSPILYLLIIFPGVLIYGIVAIIVRKKGEVEFGLCALHGRKRRNGILLVWLLILLGIASLFAGLLFVNDPDFWQLRSFGYALLWASGPTILVGSILAVFATRLLRPKKIDDYFITLRGAGPQFLDSLPPAAARPH